MLTDYQLGMVKQGLAIPDPVRTVLLLGNLDHAVESGVSRMINTDLSRVLQKTKAILLDFDGPVCAVFAGYSAAQIADRMRLELAASGLPYFDEAEQDPLLMLRNLVTTPCGLYRTMETIVQAGEQCAVESASPTPGTAEFLSVCRQQGLPVVIVTNNSRDAIERYLVRRGLRKYVAEIFARDPGDSSLMKPNPYLVNQAIEYLGRPAESCVLIGDSKTDVVAAHSAGALSIGYANKSGKLKKLQEVQADATILAMSELTQAVRPASPMIAHRRDGNSTGRPQ